MQKYTNEILQALDKEKLVKLLYKEGIESSVHQPKSDLVRLLLLAQKANLTSLSLNDSGEGRLSRLRKIIVVVVVLTAIGFLLMFNDIFQRNMIFLWRSVVGEKTVEQGDYSPTIFEKGGKTYIVYDYPLINVRAIQDSSCKRPECSLETYVNQIKNYISPLVKVNPIEYSSREGQNLISKYNLNLLPVFIFDTTIEKTENFENSKRNLEKIDDKYILQVPPYKVLKGPNLDDARKYNEGESGYLTLVEYVGLSCRLCKDFTENVREFNLELGNKIQHVIKYFNTSDRDLPVAIAVECAAQQDQFQEYFDLVLEKQDDWLAIYEPNLLNQKLIAYSRTAGLNRNLFTSCLKDENVKQIVLNHFTEAGRLGISGAPSLVVKNNILVGTYTVEQLKALLLDMLK